MWPPQVGCKGRDIVSPQQTIEQWAMSNIYYWSSAENRFALSEVDRLRLYCKAVPQGSGGM